MEDDLLSCLTRQVKEEVLENYLTQRRVVEMQLEDLKAQAEEVRSLAQQVGKRITRLGYLMIHPEMVSRLVALLKIPSPSFWRDCLDKPFSRGVRFIKVSAFTGKSKYRKLLLESYRRLQEWMAHYQDAMADFELECRALNLNIQGFHNNFDLLTILNFLKNLDVCALEQKHFLGGNFSADEIMSVEKKLYIHPVDPKEFQLPEPLELPAYPLVSQDLGRLAEEIFRRYQHQIKKLLK
ncbi:hypothetical protein SAMN02746041_01711 [Desulfacinum hydrothermale DSM 13146]|uniref:Uncharacterized protein n=1 Tax=Desulfacinum hydrothermale DSM 13146 TaxID=1121390 RepID=A0A1W1XHV0_9BACT|nr:hypothetical protein [Desulfacinum hydrothermale]SMC23362.1 hypothetical protein SAMN02746041_01711 [Desulfacinum hydrothermale DSM 13146]